MVICYSHPRKLIQSTCQICFCRPVSHSSQVSLAGGGGGACGASSEKWFDNRDTKLDILIWKLEKYPLNVTS